MKYDGRTLEPTDIEGDLVCLRPVGLSMANEFLAACLESKSALVPFMPWDCWTSAETLAFLEEANAARAGGTRFEFAVIRKGDGRFLGMMALNICDPFTPVGEIGYWVRSSETGQGVAQDALRGMVDACQRAGKFARLSAWVSSTNLASRGVLSACGFIEGRHQPLGQCCHGKWHDMIHYVRPLCDAPTRPS
ncbi:MAG: GNAT family N-acetyltransferase [Candidatus Hydrogenedentes bacterium]|nr:GNAT family N-acetyltransferase [Candidatus Hydrogenedentota bacterium]